MQRQEQDHPVGDPEGSMEGSPVGSLEGRQGVRGAVEAGGWMDRKLARLGELLSSAEGRKSLRGRIWRGMKTGLSWLTYLYFAGMGLFLFGLDWVGERNLAMAFFLYVPPLTWLVPAVPLVVMALVMRWRLLPLHLLWAGWYLFWYLDFGYFRTGEEVGAGDFEVTVMSYNSGQRSGSLQPFKDRWQPDILATQEGSSVSRYLSAPGYTEFAYGKSEKEFMVLSKYPIVGSGLITGEYEDLKSTMAAWFEIDVGEEGTFVVYNVHLPTPREIIRANLRGGMLYGIVGIPGTPWGEERESREKFWRWRIALAEQLMERIREEKRPYLVVGDFNMPANGPIYRMVSSELRDAHAVAGKGYGFTFPGTTRNPLALFGPWMRIDYLFADAGWKVGWCETEGYGRPSQHLALVAKFARPKSRF